MKKYKISVLTKDFGILEGEVVEASAEEVENTRKFFQEMDSIQYVEVDNVIISGDYLRSSCVIKIQEVK